MRRSFIDNSMTIGFGMGRSFFGLLWEIGPTAIMMDYRALPIFVCKGHAFSLLRYIRRFLGAHSSTPCAPTRHVAPSRPPEPTQETMNVPKVTR